MTRKPSKTTQSSSETSAEVARDISTLTLEAIRDHIRDVLSGKTSPPKQFTAIEHAAYLAKQASAVASEARKADKAESDGVRKLSHGAVMLWARAQTPEARARLVRDVAALDNPNRKSVLS